MNIPRGKARRTTTRGNFRHHTEHQETMIGCNKTDAWTVCAKVLYYLDDPRTMVVIEISRHKKTQLCKGLKAMKILNPYFPSDHKYQRHTVYRETISAMLESSVRWNAFRGQS